MSTESRTVWGFEDFINRIFSCFQTVVFNHFMGCNNCYP